MESGGTITQHSDVVGGFAPGPLVGLDAAIDALFASQLTPASAAEASAAVGELERLARRVQASQIELMHQIDRRGLHRGDGHASVKVLARHVGKLSGGEALGRVQVLDMVRRLDTVAAAFRSGSIGVDQVRLLARVHANPRVRGAMALRQEWFIAKAQTLAFRDFEIEVRQWERLIDEDGPEPVGERTHRNRKASLVQDPIDLSWELRASFGSLQGAAINEIFERYITAQWRSDWDAARDAADGGEVTLADLGRTHAQRRADALAQVFADAAGAPDSVVPVGFTHNIVWSAEAFEAMAARHSGDPVPVDPDTFVCRTMDGIPVQPGQAIVNAVVAALRRVLVDAKSVVIDLGERRFFTGNARQAVLLQATRCVWPGCEHAASQCEADHVLEHGGGGRTCPGNGAPLCGMHNRVKQRGFTISRDADGTWHVYRPDETGID